MLIEYLSNDKICTVLISYQYTFFGIINTTNLLLNLLTLYLTFESCKNEPVQ